MKSLYMTTYRYREHLDADDLRALTKQFLEVGTSPGVIAHYTSLDGSGGFVVQEADADPAESFKVTIQYGPWIEFETTPITTIEDAFPVIQSVYG
ncbi:hypothetical protein GCM10009844_36900 [Nocardioides koreensis]|uniref:DUF3303 domain-containing protein n=1 Tax=Nocardioides koreensis TaxID=433651 RepID=A0ABN3A361_9ACTN